MKEKIIQILNKKWVLVISSFALLTLILFLTNLMSKKLSIYPDEFRYYDLARNIYNGEWFIIHNVKVPYTKILYSILIAPFFGISNVYSRMLMISLFNSLLISSTVFPIYLITKYFKFNNKSTIITLILSIILSSNFMAIGVFQESLFYPIVLWLIYLWIINKNKQSIIIAILIGLICYLNYLCKEIALVFIITAVGFEIAFPLINKLFYLKDKKIKISYSKKPIILSVISLVSFFVVFFIFKFTLFKGFGNSYDSQTSITALNSISKFGYLIYSFIYYLVAFFVSILIFPIVYNFIFYKKFDSKIKELLIFISLYLLVLALMIAYTISIREDLFEIAPRVHLRYAYPCAYLFVILLINLMEKEDIKIQNLVSKKALFIFGCITLFCSLIFKGTRVGVGGFDDSYSLVIFNAIDVAIVSLFKLTDNTKYIVIGVVNVLLYMGIFAFLYPRKKVKNNIKIYSLLFSISIVGFVCGIVGTRMSFKGIDDNIRYCENVDNYVSNFKDRNMLCIVKETNDSSDIDLYLDKTYKTNYIVNETTIEKDLINTGSIEPLVNDIKLHETIWSYEYQKTDHIDYILMCNDVSFTKIKLDKDSLITVSNNNTYTLYKNIDPTKIKYSLI